MSDDKLDLDGISDGPTTVSRDGKKGPLVRKGSMKILMQRLLDVDDEFMTILKAAYTVEEQRQILDFVAGLNKVLTPRNDHLLDMSGAALFALPVTAANKLVKAIAEEDERWVEKEIDSWMATFARTDKDHFEVQDELRTLLTETVFSENYLKNYSLFSVFTLVIHHAVLSSLKLDADPQKFAVVMRRYFEMLISKYGTIKTSASQHAVVLTLTLDLYFDLLREVVSQNQSADLPSIVDCREKMIAELTESVQMFKDSPLAILLPSVGQSDLTPLLETCIESLGFVQMKIEK